MITGDLPEMWVAISLFKVRPLKIQLKKNMLDPKIQINSLSIILKVHSHRIYGPAPYRKAIQQNVI